MNNDYERIIKLNERLINIGRSLWLRCQKSKNKRTN